MWSFQDDQHKIFQSRSQHQQRKQRLTFMASNTWNLKSFTRSNILLCPDIASQLFILRCSLYTCWRMFFHSMFEKYTKVIHCIFQSMSCSFSLSLYTSSSSAIAWADFFILQNFLAEAVCCFWSLFLIKLAAERHTVKERRVKREEKTESETFPEMHNSCTVNISIPASVKMKD